MSGLSKLDKLMFTIGVIDSVTGPVNKIMAKVNQLTNQAKAGMRDVASGAAGVVGAGMLLASSLNPSIDALAALGEVESLGVQQQALDKLNTTALEFSTEFGGNASDVIRSAYDIQSAIAGLTGDELSSFTKASGVLATATKADVGNITSYLGTMYGIFEKTANDMGKSNWVEQLAGQTAAAVQMFKTTGPQMEQAFSRLGAGAASHGVSMAEQMAIMGQLQSTMSGSESATKYRAFLSGVGKAQKALGLSFVDSQGKLLPMIDVLQRITGKLGNIDTVAKSDLLQKAFGSKEAVTLIKQLIPQTEKLAGNIDALGRQKGMDKALEMANTIASPWDRLGGSINAASTALGQRLAPVIDPIVEMIAAAFASVIDFTGAFPMLSTVLVSAAAAAVVLMGAISAVTLLMGISKLVTAGWGLVTLGLTNILKVWTGVQWLLNAALLANPIVLIVAGIALLVGAVIGIVAYWDELVTAFRNTTWGQWIISAFGAIKSAISDFLDNSLAFQALRIGAQLLVASLEVLWQWVKFVGEIFVDVFNSAVTGFNWLREGAGAALNWIIELLGKVGGVAETAFGNWVDFLSPVLNVLKEIANFFETILNDTINMVKTLADNGIVNSLMESLGLASESPKVVQNLPAQANVVELSQYRSAPGVNNVINQHAAPRVINESNAYSNLSTQNKAVDIADYRSSLGVNSVVNQYATTQTLSESKINSNLLTQNQTVDIVADRINHVASNVVSQRINTLTNNSVSSLPVDETINQLSSNKSNSLISSSAVNKSRQVRKSSLIQQHFSTASNNESNQDKRLYIDTLNLKTDQAIDEQSLLELMELAG